MQETLQCLFVCGVVVDFMEVSFTCNKYMDVKCTIPWVSVIVFTHANSTHHNQYRKQFIIPKCSLVSLCSQCPPSS